MSAVQLSISLPIRIGQLKARLQKKLSLKNQTVTINLSIIRSKGANVIGGGYNFALNGAGKLINTGKAATLTGSIKKITTEDAKGNTTTKKYFSNSSNVAELLVENNLSAVGEIDSQNFDTLTQKNSVITFAD